MDKNLIIVLAVSWLSGLAAFLGGSFAFFEGSAESETKREIIHGIVAFGGGVLVAAVAFALTPEGIANLGPVSLALTFCCGGLTFFIIDAVLTQKGGSKAQFLAMLLDFVPEAISLGAVFGHDQRLGILLAGFIGAQNLPEGFNSYRELVSSGRKPFITLATLLGVSAFGPLAASAGYFVLQDKSGLTAGLMSFAAGGILYLVFQDIAPQAKMRRHWMPPLGAVFGFAVGMIGRQMIG